MTTGLERVRDDAADLRLGECPAGLKLVSVSLYGTEFTHQEWNHILWLHYLYVKEHGGCCGN